MQAAPFRDRTLVFTVRGHERKAVLREPVRCCPLPALLIHLAMDRRASLASQDFRRVPDIFLAAGHRVASFDLPNHGERADRHGEGLTGMAAAVRSGFDVFSDVRQTGRALIDLCIQNGIARENRIVLNGISRGGLSALHVMAGDSRALACAIYAPVTYLPALTEFAGLDDNPIVKRSNADALIERLVDRAVFIAIGMRDPRVGEENCRAFHAALADASRRKEQVLFCTPGTSHGEGWNQDRSYQMGAAFLLRHCAEGGRAQSQ